MTKNVVGLLYRSIIQHINGDKEKSKEYTKKAMTLNKNTCRCGGQTVPCIYRGMHSRLCTKCGLVMQKERIVQKCWVNSRRAV